METKRTNKISSHIVWCGLTTLSSHFNTKLLPKESCSLTPLPTTLSHSFLLKALRLFWPETQFKELILEGNIFFISFQMRRQRFNSNAGESSTGLPKGTENRTVSSLYISWAVLSSSNFSHCSSALSCTSPLWSTALLCALPVAGLTIVTAVFKEVWVIRISPGIRGRDCQFITSVF